MRLLEINENVELWNQKPPHWSVQNKNKNSSSSIHSQRLQTNCTNSEMFPCDVIYQSICLLQRRLRPDKTSVSERIKHSRRWPTYCLCFMTTAQGHKNLVAFQTLEPKNSFTNEKPTYRKFALKFMRRTKTSIILFRHACFCEQKLTFALRGPLKRRYQNDRLSSLCFEAKEDISNRTFVCDT